MGCHYPQVMTASTSPPDTDNAAFAQVAAIIEALSDGLYAGATQVGDGFIRLTYPLIEQGTEILGRTVAPIADFPLVRAATGIPGIRWLLAALGQVNAEEVRGAIAQLRRQHPLDTDEQLAQRVMLDTAGRAAQVGLLTNLVPPLALMLFALDIGAIAALQAEMIYRIATIYGFSPEAASRRGEVLAIWSVSTGSSGLAKSGLSFVELLPLIGTAVGMCQADAAW